PARAGRLCVADSPSAHSLFSVSTRSSVQVMSNSSPAATAETESHCGSGQRSVARRVPALPIDASTCPPHEMSYSTMEKLQYGGSRAQESLQPASTCSVRVGQCVHTYLHACVLRMCTAVYRASVRFCLTNFPAAHSVRSLPRLRGRGRE